MKNLRFSNCTQLIALTLAIIFVVSQVIPNGSLIGQVEAGGKGKGKGKGGNIIISTSGGHGSYSVPIPIPIPIHCEGGKSYWRRRRR